jgi:hypothetical protein
MSLGLEHYKNQRLGGIDDIVSFIVDTKYFDDFFLDSITPDNEDYLSIINSVEHMMRDTINQESFHKITDDFFSCAVECGLSAEELYKFYIGKNILNGFRQDHGYKEGTYIKVWQGKEDNDVMMALLDEDSTLGAHGLYTKLSEAYAKIS